MRSHWFIGLSRFVTGLAVLSWLAGGAVQAWAGGYDLSVLVETGDISTIAGKTITRRGSDPRLNDAGDVTFIGDFNGGECGSISVLTSPGCGVFSTLRDQLFFKSGDIIAGETLISIGDGDLNNNGLAAYNLTTESDEHLFEAGIFTHDGVTRTLVVAPRTIMVGGAFDGETFGPGLPVLNDNGVIGFPGHFPDLNVRALFTHSGGVNTIVAKQGDPVGSKFLNLAQNSGQLAINNLGNIALATDFTDGSRGIVTRIGGTWSVLVATGSMIAGKTITQVVQTSINNHDEVVYLATFDDGSKGVISSDKGILAQTGDFIDDVEVTVIQRLGGINDDGTVLFTSGGNLFTQSNVVVARDGLIEGRSLPFGAGIGEINSSGTIAFVTTFQDDSGTFTSAIIVAEPILDEDEDGFTVEDGDCDDLDPAVNPAAQELCNNIDDNCNGTVDDGFNVGDACTVGIGSCEGSGAFVCTVDGSTTECSAIPGTPTLEVCNGIDDDCNGLVDDISITAVAGGPYPVDEGDSVSVTASATPEACGTRAFAWDLDNNGSFETPGQSASFSAAGLDGPSSPVVSVQVTDGPAVATAEATIDVMNVAPTVGAIAGQVDPVQVETLINMSAEFTDPGEPDTHTAVWDWGDGTQCDTTTDVDCTVTENAGDGSVTGSHTYTEPGVYEVTLTVTDDDSDSGEAVFQFVVVFDPEGGFVTGGGWIDSPEGACHFADCTTDTTGKANFGFVSKYKKGASVPTGNTEFNFSAGGLNFHSDIHQWLVVNQDGTNAQFKGDGTINGENSPNGPYKFMIWAKDDAPDTFRIKIWYENSGEVVVYDNGFNQAIGGGNIKVHDGK